MAAATISTADVEALKAQNDELEAKILEFTRKLNTDEPEIQTARPTVQFGGQRGIKVHKFSHLPQFVEQANSDRGTPFIPMQCKKRGPDGTMFTS